jgi:hypothetical protein
MCEPKEHLVNQPEEGIISRIRTSYATTIPHVIVESIGGQVWG